MGGAVADKVPPTRQANRGAYVRVDPRPGDRPGFFAWWTDEGTPAVQAVAAPFE